MPSLSSGATAEYHRSRQSHDSSVRSLARPILSDPHRHQASDRRPLLARHTLRRGGTSDRKGRSAEAAPSALAMTTSEEVGTPRTDSGDPIRTRRLEADRSSEPHGRSRRCSLPSPLPIDDGKPSSIMGREPAVANLSSATRRHDGSRSKRTQRASDPTFRRKPVVASPSPSDLTPSEAATRQRCACRSLVDRRRS
jgi:hypothetical protein